MKTIKPTGFDITYPLAVMADHDLIYSEIRGQMKGLALFIALVYLYNKSKKITKIRVFHRE